MAEKIRIGIVGCGGIGPFHAEALKEVETAVLTAVADCIPERAQTVGEKYGVPWHGCIEDLLARDDVDAVAVCTYSGLHAEHGMMAARAGKHVLSEKPMDVLVERVDELTRVCRECGVTLGGIFQNRFARNGMRARRIIAEGYLGEIVYASASCLWYRKQSYYDSGEWRGTWALDGGALANQGIHSLDRLVWLTGMQPEVISAYCPTLERDIEAEDLGVAMLKFPNGAGGTVQATTLANPGLAAQILVCGTKGCLKLEDNEMAMLQTEDPLPDDLADATGGGGSSSGASDPAAIGVGGHAANIREFVSAITEGREPSVNGAEGRKAVQLLNDIYRAAGVGRWAKASAK